MEHDIMVGLIFVFGIAMFICIGCILANGTQEHIDYMNERIRQDEYKKRQQMYGDKNE
jgi:hypothetical protein